MSPTVSLRQIIDEMSFISDEVTAYLHKETGKIVSISREELELAEAGDWEDAPEWQKEAIEEASAVLNTDNYLALPGKFEIHEWAIMQSFCYSVDDEELSSILLDKIHGAKAFRRFKDALHQYDLAESWYRFRDEALKEIAVEWLKQHNIAYVDDTAQSEH